MLAVGKKLLTVLGIGAGIALVRRELRENPEGGVAKTVNAVTSNPQVRRAGDVTKQKASEIFRRQGEAVTDKIEDVVKERIFGVAPASNSEPEFVDVEIEEITVEGPDSRL